MINVLFICHGNICRSPMAEFMFKDMVNKKGFEGDFYIESAAVSSEGKRARKMTKADYDKFDYILAMEEYNIDRIMRIIGSDPENKVHLLLDYTDRKGDIADPWYTGNFDITYDDILEGLEGFLKAVNK